MKRFLWSSTGDLTTVFKKFAAFWAHQASEIEAIRRHDVHKISSFMLKDLYLTKLVKPSGCCPCSFNISMGPPCRHLLFKRLEEPVKERASLRLDDFDVFWHVQQAPIYTGFKAPFEPLVVRGKGRPKGALNLENTRSTRRDPSAYEIVEGIERSEATKAPPPPPPSTAPPAFYYRRLGVPRQSLEEPQGPPLPSCLAF
ncbi:hypothetical protein HRG_012372 [Hirsutella rhossiliensis]